MAEPDSELIDNTRVGYQTAAELWMHEGAAAWDRFNAMLVANSIILGAVGVLLGENSPRTGLAWVVGFVGLLLSIVWALLVRRSYAYQYYFGATARSFEQELGIETFRRMDRYSSGTWTTEDKSTAPLKRPWPAALNMERLGLVVVGAFALVYLLALVALSVGLLD
jgi:hypothetical protein